MENQNYKSSESKKMNIKRKTKFLKIKNIVFRKIFFRTERYRIER